MSKIKCSECKARFEVDLKEYDDGDILDCPECGAELIVEYDTIGKARVRTPKEKFLEEDEEFEEADDSAEGSFGKE